MRCYLLFDCTFMDGGGAVTWLSELATDKPPAFTEGAHALQRRISSFVQHIQDEGIASPYALSALWELVETIEEWCGRDGNDNAGDDNRDVW